MRKQNQGDLPIATFEEEPHEKKFMPSRVARLVDRASYRDILVATATALLASATLFAVAPVGHGLVNSEKADLSRLSNWPECLYFSVVTLTSLGYGDIAPQGLSRVMAGALVLYGVAAMALFIGKLASERSQATLMLLHTSDRERRLRQFSEELKAVNQRIARAALIQRAADLSRSSADLSRLLSAISHYVVFHAHHSSLGDFGNAPILVPLVKELLATVGVAKLALRSPSADAAVAERASSQVERTFRLVNFIALAHRRTDRDFTRRALDGLLRRKPEEPSPPASQVRMVLAMTTEVDVFRREYRTQPHAAMVAWVFAACPSGQPNTWPRQLNKKIALKLQIGNTLAQRCIDKLLLQRRLPK